MRLAIKFAMALTVGVILVLAAQAMVNVSEASEIYQRQSRADLYASTRSLSEAAGEIWSIRGWRRAQAYLERIDEMRPQTSVRLVHDAEFERRREEFKEIDISRMTDEDEWYLVGRAPVFVEGQLVAGIELQRSLPNEREYYESVLHTQILSSVAVAIVCAVIAIILGMLLIGRPVRRLTALAHRVAAGDFSLSTDLDRRDEIGSLGRELNVMTAKLAESSEQIRSERRARTKALEQLRHADRLSTVGKIASSVAHEIGTPLNVVTGRAKMIYADESLPEEARTNAKIIAEQAERITQIVREILSYGRSKPLDRNDVRISEVLEHACSLMQPIADERGIKIFVEGSVELSARVDSGRILQVVTNLIVNAIHAMPNGGKIALVVERKNIPKPKYSQVSPGDFVCITVKDEGVGIPEEKFKDIFKPFFTTKEEGQGTGLGLTVCHSITHEHGGWIDLESQVGKGSSFTVCLPEKEET